MSNAVLERIQSQTRELIKPSPQIIETSLPISPAISPSKLKEMLLSALEETKVEEVISEEIREFKDIYQFCDWYEVNKESFLEKQKVALDTLVAARNAISEGCNCKRQQREQGAFSYFRVFWENNKTNDLLPTVLKNSKTKKISFGNFLTFPF